MFDVSGSRRHPAIRTFALWCNCDTHRRMIHSRNSVRVVIYLNNVLFSAWTVLVWCAIPYFVSQSYFLPSYPLLPHNRGWQNERMHFHGLQFYAIFTHFMRGHSYFLFYIYKNRPILIRLYWCLLKRWVLMHRKRSVSTHRHFSNHRFCNACSAFTCRRDHYGLPVRFLVMGHIEPH